MTQPFRDDPKRARALHRANKILTVVIFVAYPCLLLWLLWQKDMRLYKAICVPLDGFIIVTVVGLWSTGNGRMKYLNCHLWFQKIRKDIPGRAGMCFPTGSDCVTVLVCVPRSGIVFLLMTVAVAWIRVFCRSALYQWCSGGISFCCVFFFCFFRIKSGECSVIQSPQMKARNPRVTLENLTSPLFWTLNRTLVLFLEMWYTMCMKENLIHWHRLRVQHSKWQACPHRWLWNRTSEYRMPSSTWLLRSEVLQRPKKSGRQSKG